jgi:YggT family protein
VITILFGLLREALSIYRIIVIVWAIFSLLISFGVLDTRNRIVWQIGDVLERLTEPALRPIRRFLPNFGGIDFSPWVLIILISVAQAILDRLYAAIVFGNVQGLLL